MKELHFVCNSVAAIIFIPLAAVFIIVFGRLTQRNGDLREGRHPLHIWLPSVGPIRVARGSEATYMWRGNEAVILVLEEATRNGTQPKWTEKFTTDRSEEIVIIINY